MPVPSDVVPLQTAKAWAKRLSKTSKTVSPSSPWPLSRCQLAVAQMLGYEHWHALEVAFGSSHGKSPFSTVVSAGMGTDPEMLSIGELGDVDPTGSSQVITTVSSPLFSRKDDAFKYHGFIPETKDEWRNFWINCLSIPGCEKVYLIWKDDEFKVSLIVNGSEYFLANFNASSGTFGVLNFTPFNFLEDINIEEGAWVKLSWFEVDGENPYIRIFANKDRAYSAVIQKELPIRSNSYFSVNSEIKQKVFDLLDKQKAFFFTGYEGGYQTDFMKEIMIEAQQRNSSTKSIKTISAGGLFLSEKGFQKVIDKDIKDIGGLVDIVSPVDDCLVFGRLMNKETVNGLQKAVRRSIPTVSGLVSASHNVIGELNSFVEDCGWVSEVSGWVYVTNIKLACPHCVYHQKSGRAPDRCCVKGCCHCYGLGTIGDQILVDVWEVVDGVPNRIISLKDQVIDLHTKCLVETHNAQYYVSKI